MRLGVPGAFVWQYEVPEEVPFKQLKGNGVRVDVSVVAVSGL